MNQLKTLLLIAVFLMNTSIFAQEAIEKICIGEKIKFRSEILNQVREISIKLPENYEDQDLSFPVHYVLDGEIIFNSYSSITELKAQNEEIPAALIIGIANIDRRFDLNPRANGGKFLDFITKELIPYIDKQYRTNNDRVLTGYSMAGNYVIYALLNSQESFNMYLAGSPYRLDMYTNVDIDNLMQNLKSTKTLYTSIGSTDRVKQVQFFNLFCEQFDKKNKALINFKYEVVANRNHDNNFLINWQDGLDYIYKDWKPTTK